MTHGGHVTESIFWIGVHGPVSLGRNRGFEILRAMLADLAPLPGGSEHIPDACANIVKNPRRPWTLDLNCC